MKYDVVCEVAGCGNLVRATGLCGKHYMRMKTHGNVNTDNRTKERTECSIENCKNNAIAKGICNVHYARKFRHGSTDSKMPTYGSYRIVTAAGYVRIWTGQRYEMEHILIAEKALGKKLPFKAVIHHVDGNKGNNAPTNLVICPSQSYHFLLHMGQRARDAREFGESL